MMGVYIKGMEMPDTGSYLVVIDNNTPGKTFITFKRAYDSRQIVGSYEAVPVPKHGDLIDRDETINTLAHDYAYAAADVVRDEIPTIIPADKEENNE